MTSLVKKQSREMVQRLEERNQEIWSGHSTILEDVTHVLSGVGIGLLMHPVFKTKVKSVGWTMILLSTAIHFYADSQKRERDSDQAG